MITIKISLNKIPIFSSLDQNQIADLQNILSVKEFTKDRIIFFEGDSPELLYIVISGEVHIVKTTRDGKEKILAIMEEGDFFGEMSIIEGDKRSATARTNQDSQIIVIEKNNFLRFIKNNPNIALKIMIELSHRLRRADDDIKNLAFFKVEKRLYNFLHYLGRSGKSNNKNELVIDRNITHYEIASFIGTSRETVTRIINKMQDKGLLEIKKNKIILK